MDLVIKDEVYKIKVGAEVYSVEYPSFNQAIEIANQFKEINGDGAKSVALMKEWLIKLGLSDPFFEMKAIKSKHIVTIWTELNNVKK